MQYQELHQRYGSHIAKRVKGELRFSEFSQVALRELPAYLEIRAETAHKEYQVQLDNPFAKETLQTGRTSGIDLLHRRWREAEEIAYLVTIAENVSTNAHVTAQAS